MKKENKRLQFAQKIGMTILLLLLIRFMSHIPVPGVKSQYVQACCCRERKWLFSVI